MKKFLLNIGLFTVILSIVNAYAFFVIEKVYHSGTDYIDVDLSFNHYILTDSHANPLKGHTEQYGIYNFAYGSESYYDMRRKMSYLIENTEVQTIFITVGSQAVSKYRDISNNLDRSIEFASVSDYTSYFAYVKDKYITRYITLLNPKVRSLVRVYTQNSITDLIKKEADESPAPKNSPDTDTATNQDPEDTGWAAYSEETRNQRAKNRFDIQFPDDKPSVRLMNELHDIVRIAKDNEIRLIGISYPLSNEYLELLDANNINYSGAPILEEAGYEVYDFSDYYTDKQHYFGNQDHLNDTGGEALAEEFSRILNGDFEQ